MQVTEDVGRGGHRGGGPWGSRRRRSRTCHGGGGPWGSQRRRSVRVTEDRAGHGGGGPCRRRRRAPGPLRFFAAPGVRCTAALSFSPPVRSPGFASASLSTMSRRYWVARIVFAEFGQRLGGTISPLSPPRHDCAIQLYRPTAKTSRFLDPDPDLLM